MIDEFGKLAWKFLFGRKCTRRKDPSPGHVSQHLLRKTDPDGKASRATSNGVCFVSTSTDEIYCASLTNVHQREMASMCRAKDKIGWVVIGDGTTCK